MKSDDQTSVGFANDPDAPGPVRKERLATALILLFIAFGTLVDVYQDRIDGAPWHHVVSELLIVLFALGMAFVLVRRAKGPLLLRNLLLERELTAARADAQKWQRENRDLTSGLSASISRQLDGWSLSAAEKEVALLLLKGLSHKEIADIRSTSESTVRQQSASVYQKSGLAGRAELSAFFLEDLLVLPGGATENTSRKSER